MRIWVPSLLFLALAVSVLAQHPTSSCEQQVSEAYLSLTKDQLLALVPDLSWSQQLTAMASSPRELRTLWEIKRNQVDLAEKNVAQLLEQLRQAQAQIQLLKAQTPSSPPGQAESPRN